MEYLVFVDEIGMTLDGDYIYRFDFNEEPDVVWGDYFNVVPSAIVPDLQVDKNALTKCAKVIFPQKMLLAKKNFCFSMQDCIDGIIPLIFTDITDKPLMKDEKPFYLPFGLSYPEVKEYLKKYNLSLAEEEEVKKGDESAIDQLINDLENEEQE